MLYLLRKLHRLKRGCSKYPRIDIFHYQGPHPFHIYLKNKQGLRFNTELTF